MSNTKLVQSKNSDLLGLDLGVMTHLFLFFAILTNRIRNVTRQKKTERDKKNLGTGRAGDGEGK